MQDLPLGFEFALAQIEQSKTMQSRTEMRNFVQHLSQQQGGF